MSFCYERLGQGAQLLRVDLTSSPDSIPGTLSRHFQELRRRVQRVYGYDVRAFIVQTKEGQPAGVLHMIWAISQSKAVWIDQKWISDQWENIHGAKVAWISRLPHNGVKNVARYFSCQYLAGQESIVRISWPWGSL
jgi:hypothetical protein